MQISTTLFVPGRSRVPLEQVRNRQEEARDDLDLSGQQRYQRLIDFYSRCG